MGRKETKQNLQNGILVIYAPRIYAPRGVQRNILTDLNAL